MLNEKIIPNYNDTSDGAFFLITNLIEFKNSYSILQYPSSFHNYFIYIIAPKISKTIKRDKKDTSENDLSQK